MKTTLPKHLLHAAVVLALATMALPLPGAETQPANAWKVGTPIVAYWAGPALTDKVADELVAGGWNLAWCLTEKQLDVAQRHGLRAQFQHGLIAPNRWTTRRRNRNSTR